MNIRFHIPGTAVAKGRAIASPMGHHYTPPRTTAYEEHVRHCGGNAMHQAGLLPMAGAVSVTLEILIMVPRSWSRRKQALALAGALLPTSKPDLSNIVKSLEDGLNGVVWVDDVQIVSASTSKRYGDPGVWVSVEEIQSTE